MRNDPVRKWLWNAMRSLAFETDQSRSVWGADDHEARAPSAMHDQIRHDRDCTESALRLMALRTEIAALVAEWRAAGGSEPLPTTQERLKANNRPAQKPEAVTRQ
jgi:hypothetical protein